MLTDVKTESLRNLVEKFRGNFNQYKSGQYNEATTRADFIDPFFELLDWDINNKQGWDENYREVVLEDKVTRGYAESAGLQLSKE